MDDSSKPLRSKVLAVPEYRERYLSNVRTLAETSLDWNRLGPFVASQAELIDSAVKAETRKLGTYEAFRAAVDTTHSSSSSTKPTEFHGGHGSMNLKEFADGRRDFLLNATK